MTLKRSIARRLPPLILDVVRAARRRPLRFDGEPTNWDEAVRMSGGYDSEDILSRVSAATREVVAGNATFERDSVLFQERQLPFQIVAPLLHHALRHDGHLEVIDFGGSLGSTYRQIRWFLPQLRTLRWHVVEQPGFVAAGNTEFATDELRFYTSVLDLPPSPFPRVALLSSVLQYLPEPPEVLTALTAAGTGTLIIDRTSLSGATEDHLTIQRVSSRIYPASYPCWVLSRARLLEQLAGDWRLLLEFPCPEGSFTARGGPHFEFKGLILERRTCAVP